jgi:hypothetical protein
MEEAVAAVKSPLLVKTNTAQLEPAPKAFQRQKRVDA